MSINVLVLGAGGNVSQGILKALAISSLRCRVVAACITSRAFGLHTADKAYISPRADSPEFAEWLFRVCREDGIDAVLSGVEPVLEVLSGLADRLRSETGAIAVVSSPDCLAIGDDKLRTCTWLQDHGLPYPNFADATDRDAINALVENCKFPLIAKPRAGKGAHGVETLSDRRQLERIAGREGYIIQQYLGNPNEEYTAGTYSDKAGDVRGVIVLRRELLDGTTYRAEAGDFPDVRAAALRMAQILGPMGPANFQMRIHHGVPVCFEVNVRFSGTTPIRARLGFNDVEAALRHYVLGEPAVDLPQISQGIALRYWNEAYIDGKAITELERTGELEMPRRFKPVIDTYGIW